MYYSNVFKLFALDLGQICKSKSGQYLGCGGRLGAPPTGRPLADVRVRFANPNGKNPDKTDVRFGIAGWSWPNALLFITSKSNGVTTDYRRRLFAGKDRTKSQCSHVTLNFMTLTFNSIPLPLGLISCKKISTKPVTQNMWFVQLKPYSYARIVHTQNDQILVNL